MKKLWIYILFLKMTIGTATLNAQDKLKLELGVEFVSRYVWRGIDYGNSPAIQPDLLISYHGFFIGGWGSYALFKKNNTTEFEYRLGYTFERLGMTILLTDYYYSTALIDTVKKGFSREENISFYGHSIELGLIQNFKNFYFGCFMNLNEDHHLYLESGYNYKGFEFVIGAGNRDYTSEGEFYIVNLSLVKNIEIKYTESRSLSLFWGGLYNPDTNVFHFVFGATF
ncbi:TorF family putative porin [Sediminitomix flava]|uniref:Uncharacterized protein Gcw-chp n=1 Tax=Sediminitomix flava TaxID=379075 RepID=A0A315Z9A1_SEDFL|nr:TorF family putative porin [Sediminitomix flava]PWJ41779.1 uncharacterized protein Gcw-chp [Sediminitomix flava]